jgi:adenylate kinase
VLRALFLAPPGAGKGTQGPSLADRYGVPYIATGDMLREHVANDTPLGRAAKEHMDSGGLVPDQLVVEMVSARLARPTPLAGFVLDGFPRTLNQALAAYEWGKENDRTFDAVISLEVPRAELIRRVQERQRKAGRDDDDLDTFRHRLEVYDHDTQPLIAFYRDRGILLEIEGTGTVDDIQQRILDSLAAAGHGLRQQGASGADVAPAAS